MIRRNSSKARQSHQLGRSKSMNCITRGVIHDDVRLQGKLAHRDAHIAAALSYERYNSGTELSSDYYAPDPSPKVYNYNRFPRESSPIRHSQSIQSKLHNRKQLDDAAILPRKQSVRFAGPNGRQTRTNIRKTETTSDGSQTLVESQGGQACTSHKSNPESSMSYPRGERNPFRSSDMSERRQCADVYSSTLREPPLPLSNRKLRKSRSMFLPVDDSSNRARRPYDRLEEWLMPNHAPFAVAKPAEIRNRSLNKIRSPKSMSFLRSNATKESLTSRGSARQDRTLAVGSLRANLDLPSKKLKSHSSMIFFSRSKKKSSSLVFSDSMRNSSGNTDPVSSTISLPKTTGFRSVARKASTSLRKKFKGMFSRSRADGGASQSTFIIGSDQGSFCNTDTSHHEEASISRVRSHVPSLHSISSYKFPHSRRGSVESVECETVPAEDERSRVTSWTNSSTHTAISQVTTDWEKQRLSVINESGQGTMKTDNVSRTCTPKATQVSPDQQRVYSALVKKLDEMNQRQNQDNVENEEKESTRQITPSRPSNYGKFETGWTPTTIRCVQDDDDVFRIQDSAEDNSIYKEPEHQKSEDDHDKCRSVTPIPKSNSNSPHKMLTRSSAFFGSPSNHLFRTQSPYRRALQQSMKTQQESPSQITSPDSRYLNSLSALILPTRQPSPENAEKDIHVTSAESIYSLHSDTPERSPRVPLKSQEPILGDLSSQTKIQKRNREVSSASSVEWKTWLSENVSRLEASCQLSSDINTLESLPKSLGHVREDAEIDSKSNTEKVEDENYSNNETKPLVGFQKDSHMPLNPIDPNGNNIMRRSSVSNENCKPATIESFKSVRQDIPPVAPLRIGLRTAASLPNVKGQVKKPRSHNSNTASLTNSPIKKNISNSNRKASFARHRAASSIHSSPGGKGKPEQQRGEDLNLYSEMSSSWAWQQHSKEPAEEYLHEMNSDLEAQTVGSKRIVDLFLSSRRNQQGSRHVNGATNSSPVFI